jgi:anti-sigma factor RsiW
VTTCGDAEALLDAFVDAELPSETMLEIARHAGQCERCDRAVRDLVALRAAVVADVEHGVDGLDLAPVWAQIDAVIARSDAQAAWHERAAARRRRLTGLPLWGSVAAIAAGAALLFRGPALQQVARGPNDVIPTAAVRVAAKRLPNHVYIDRLAGKDIALRSEPKSGTTIIWVNHEAEGTGW